MSDLRHVARDRPIPRLFHSRRLGRGGPGAPGRHAAGPQGLRDEGRGDGDATDRQVLRPPGPGEQDEPPGARGTAPLRAGAGDPEETRYPGGQCQRLPLRLGAARPGAQAGAAAADRYAGGRRLHRGAFLRALRRPGAAPGRGAGEILRRFAEVRVAAFPGLPEAGLPVRRRGRRGAGDRGGAGQGGRADQQSGQRIPLPQRPPGGPGG